MIREFRESPPSLVGKGAVWCTFPWTRGGTQVDLAKATAEAASMEARREPSEPRSSCFRWSSCIRQGTCKKWSCVRRRGFSEANEEDHGLSVASR